MKSPKPPLPAPVPALALACTEIPGGVEFAVLASAGSAVSRIRGIHGAALKVALRAAPEKGKANEELLSLLAETFGLPRHQVTLISGQTSRKKRVRVLGLTADQLQNAIRSLES